MNSGKQRKRTRRLLGLLLILGGLSVGYLLLRSRLDPLVRDLAVTSARNAMNHCLQDAILRRSESGELGYDRLIRLILDGEGRVAAATADMGAIHAVASGLSRDVLNAIEEGFYSDLSVPLGNLLGVPLLSGYGPEIPIRILSVSQADAQVFSSLSDGGINQTLHRIVLELHMEIYVLIPGKTLITECYVQMPIAETILLGQVPENYMYFESGEEWDEPLEQFDVLT